MTKKKNNIQVYEIEKDVAIPEIKRGVTIVPISKLEVGESIMFPLQSRNSVASYASKLKAKFGKEFTVRQIGDDKCRIWRTK